MKIPYFCCIGAELKRYAQDFDFMNQVYLYKVPTDDSIDEVLAEDYFKAISNSVLQDDIVYIYEANAETLHECRFDKQNGHITAVPLASDETLTGAVTSIIHDNLTPNKLLKSDGNGKVAASNFSENDFVKVDGSSTMTGVLKMRASASFECAIAPYWHGVGFYKLNDNDSVTLLASMEATDGFEPGTNNTYNIGSTTKKWKNLYLAGKAFVSTINNGYDIAVPVTNSADTLALKSQVDLAANSGSQLYDTGVWYAKMNRDTVVPTGAEYNDRNYADFSQVDRRSGRPIIVIYSCRNGVWDEVATITPPDSYNGYITVTSKIWDIPEQAGQQGGEILWSFERQRFTPYPKIVSFESINVTGNSTVIMPLTPTDDNIVNKRYVDNAISSYIFPVGGIIQFGGSNAPAGWLLCNGQAVSRTTYADLFAIIGTAYGVGDGSTTFNLPDYSDRVPQGNGQGYVSAGLPNITSYLNASGLMDYRSTPATNWYNRSGAFDVFVSGNNYTDKGFRSGGAVAASMSLSFDASRSSPIYGASTTVQPPATKTYFIIKY